MTYIIFILLHVLVPIFIPIGLGYLVQKMFDLHTNTLSKIQFFILIPCFLFTKIYGLEIEMDLVLNLLVVLILVFISVYILSLIVAKVLHYDHKLRNAFVNANVFYNSGNYCIPLVDLLYTSNAYASGIQLIQMLLQNVLINVIGIFNTNVGNKSVKAAIMDIFKIPMMYVLIISLLFNIFQWPVYEPIQEGLELGSEGLVPIALITLGAQLAKTKIKFTVSKVYIASFVRLVVAPLLAMLYLMAFGIGGVPAQVIMICSGAPSAINVLLLAIEFDSEPEFASQTIFMSTIISAVSISIMIYIAQLVFPV